jgi:hypothetical protein
VKEENGMKPWVTALLGLVVPLIIFLGVTLFTGNWGFFMWGTIVVVLVGVPIMSFILKLQKKTKNNSV